MKRTLGWMPVAAGGCSSCWAWDMSAGRPAIRGRSREAEQRQVDQFEKISIEGSADVTVTVGPETTLSVETDDNILPLITTRVSNGELTIGSDDPYTTKLGVKVTITTPSLSAVSIAGSGDVKASGVSGKSFAVAIAGSGDVTATGTVQQVSAAIQGSGDIRLEGLEAKQGKVAVSGSGDVRLHVTETLTVSIAGSGDVRYKGGTARREEHRGGGERGENLSVMRDSYP